MLHSATAVMAISYLEPVCTTVSFLPQLVHGMRLKTPRDILRTLGPWSHQRDYPFVIYPDFHKDEIGSRKFGIGLIRPADKT